MIRHKKSFCYDCGQRVRAANNPNYWVTNWVLVFLTCGLWAPIFLLMHVWKGEPFYCPWCGDKV